MSYRFTLTALAAFSLLGCAKPVTGEPAADFTTGPTLVTVEHAWTRTDDGTTVYVTVDGKDAAALKVGESVALRLPEGTYQIGGYAKSLIGKVSVAPVKLTTTANSKKAVEYAVTKSKPEFKEVQPEEITPSAEEPSV
ncbi:hypothetical protein MUA02_19155 [Enterobacteriaceae bacterium H20N1]|uniref:Lipoprotein n=1 Tax=Dryocola boscaweniae TaxID=2925397 RepID=A0A9X2WAC0_9ENTR|nr:hypothetical protein [Dryocola boscaweniae]MCT4703976.1 hypothetical protein [Dryocola boscaweniae]MCT4717154.1 hypothetical protein [Dryocola boscaweniae]MCT4721144.1 hypothetical protein [Dryocola boscaweniae]